MPTHSNPGAGLDPRYVEAHPGLASGDGGHPRRPRIPELAARERPFPHLCRGGSILVGGRLVPCRPCLSRSLSVRTAVAFGDWPRPARSELYAELRDLAAELYPDDAAPAGSIR